MHVQECGAMGEAELVKDGTCSLLGLFWGRFAKCYEKSVQGPIRHNMLKCRKRGIVNASAGFMRVYPAYRAIIEQRFGPARTWKPGSHFRASAPRTQIGDIFP